jgi:uncharacterized membrane protein YfcA
VSADGLLLVLMAAVAANALGAALGMAGGIFVVPMLTLGAGISFASATAISLISVVACSCASAPQFLASKLTNLRLAVVLEVATTSGALVGLLLTNAAPASVLYGLFAAVLLVSAVQMLMRRKEAAEAAPDGRRWGVDGYYPDDTGREVPYRVQRLPLGFAMMGGAGLLASVLGIGSGVLKIPAMDAAMRLPLKVSSATANLMIGVTACGAAAAELLMRHVDLPLVTPVALGSVAGSILGARLLTRLAGPTLRVLFVVVLLALSIAMAASAGGWLPGVRG